MHAILDQVTEALHCTQLSQLTRTYLPLIIIFSACKIRSNTRRELHQIWIYTSTIPNTVPCIYRRIKVQTILYFSWRIGAEMLESLWLKIKVSLRRFDTKLTPNTLAILPARSVHQQFTVLAWTVLVACLWALRVTDISCQGREHIILNIF